MNYSKLFGILPFAIQNNQRDIILIFDVHVPTNVYYNLAISILAIPMFVFLVFTPEQLQCGIETIRIIPNGGKLAMALK